MSIKTPVSITQVSFGNGPPMNYSISDATGRDLSWEEICAALNERDRLRDANESLQARLRELESFHNEVGAAIANEGPHTIEHLLATASLGKCTTVIGRLRLKTLATAEQRAEAAEAKLAEVERLQAELAELRQLICDLRNDEVNLGRITDTNMGRVFQAADAARKE